MMNTRTFDEAPLPSNQHNELSNRRSFKNRTNY
uniref:Uncharacterized protein n=1 Tax=Rhizophora mucronata TaxID=61149 RepID=A0A2P2NER4_RHIMU